MTSASPTAVSLASSSSSSSRRTSPAAGSPRRRAITAKESRTVTVACGARDGPLRGGPHASPAGWTDHDRRTCPRARRQGPPASAGSRHDHRGRRRPPDRHATSLGPPRGSTPARFEKPSSRDWTPLHYMSDQCRCMNGPQLSNPQTADMARSIGTPTRRSIASTGCKGGSRANSHVARPRPMAASRCGSCPDQDRTAPHPGFD